MLTIRLSRIGKKKKPMYRLIISEKTSVSPGLHFLNASNIGMIPIDLNGLAKDHIYPFGTYLFQNHAPTHPTYDLFVDSYLKTKKILC